MGGYVHWEKYDRVFKVFPAPGTAPPSVKFLTDK